VGDLFQVVMGLEEAGTTTACNNTLYAEDLNVVTPSGR
jgi:hypothetical protein